MTAALLLAPPIDKGGRVATLTPAELAAEAWRLYLAHTRNLTGATYEWREQNEYRRLKGTLARLRVEDEERLMAARDHLRRG